jgi:hypothetical protein
VSRAARSTAQPRRGPRTCTHPLPRERLLDERARRREELLRALARLGELRQPKQGNETERCGGCASQAASYARHARAALAHALKQAWHNIAHASVAHLRARTHRNARTRARTYLHARSHARTRAHKHARTSVHKRTHTVTGAHTHARTHARTHTSMRTHARAHHRHPCADEFVLVGVVVRRGREDEFLARPLRHAHHERSMAATAQHSRCRRRSRAARVNRHECCTTRGRSGQGLCWRSVCVCVCVCACVCLCVCVSARACVRACDCVREARLCSLSHFHVRSAKPPYVPSTRKSSRGACSANSAKGAGKGTNDRRHEPTEDANKQTEQTNK